MAYFSFTEKIIKDDTMKIFNNEDMSRDFTYVDDIVLGIINLLEHPPEEEVAWDKYNVYNIRNNKLETRIEEGERMFVEWYMEIIF